MSQTTSTRTEQRNIEWKPSIEQHDIDGFEFLYVNGVHAGNICRGDRFGQERWFATDAGADGFSSKTQAKAFVESKAVLMLSPEDLRSAYLQRYPEAETTAEEYVALGLADHPDFLRLMATSLVMQQDEAAADKAKLFAEKLLTTAREFSVRPSCAVIGGHRCGVQSCDASVANVYAEIKGDISYVRLARKEKKVINPHYTNPAYAFVQAHYDAFEQLCSKLDQSKSHKIKARVKPTCSQS